MLVKREMKLDGRTLDHKTLEQIRLMAVQRVREDEKPADVIASFGLCRTTIYKWINAAAGRGRGLKALRSTRGTGRPRSPTPAQERQVFRWINGRNPPSIRVGLRVVDASYRFYSDQARVRRGYGSHGRWGAAGQAWTDTAKTVTARLSARPAGYRALATRNLSGYCRQGTPGPRSFSGMSLVFAPTRCTIGPGVYVARHRWWSAPANASRFRPPRGSMRVAASGSRSTKARSTPNCSWNCSST